MRLRARLTLGALVAGAVLIASGIAGAHAFLVDTDPVQGERLASPPEEVAFQLTEPAVVEQARIELRKAEGQELLTGPVRAEAGGRVLRVPLPPLEDGIYLVSWHVVSAVDAHQSAGEFAFGVGEVTGSLPRPTEQTVPLSIPEALARWVFLAGFAWGAGALAARRFLQAVPRGERGGVLMALVGAASTHLLTLGGGSPSLGTRLGAATVATLALAALLLPFSRKGTAPLALLVTAAALWAGRSHLAAAGGAWGTALDFVHLVAAGAWVGLLAQVVIQVWRARRERRTAIPAILHRYAGLALWLVAILGAVGLVAAVRLLPRLADLWTTTYGRTLLVKSLLVVGAISLALLGRRRGLRQVRVGLLGRSTTSELALLVAVLAASALLGSLGAPAAGSATEALLGPPPLEGPVARGAGLAGEMTVGLAAGDDQLQLEVFSPSGGIGGTELELGATFPDGREADLHPRPCGAGCFSQHLELPEGITRLSIGARAPG
ncbi:MAG: copper resistance protein CopC/CopD, partial [Actinomycetota bacterium]|nr:copper resistance protein CopC/CopD [Actinomycetota bacterium]